MAMDLKDQDLQPVWDNKGTKSEQYSQTQVFNKPRLRKSDIRPFPSKAAQYNEYNTNSEQLVDEILPKDGFISFQNDRFKSMNRYKNRKNDQAGNIDSLIVWQFLIIFF